MKISLPTLRGPGKKRRTAHPVTRSKSLADKNVVNMKLLWRDRKVSQEQACINKYVSTPDLTARNTVKIADVNTTFTANSLKDARVKTALDILTSPVNNTTPSLRTPHPEQVYTPIRQSSLSLILPDNQETGRKRTRSVARPKTGGSTSKSLKSVKFSTSSRSCVQEDCVVCTLARPDLRHRVVLQPEFWREFY